MPVYRVIEKGFYDGRLYDPAGKRRTITRDKPFSKAEMPSWVEPIKQTAAAAKSAAASKKKAAATKKKVEDDQKDIQAASFMGDGEAAGADVETLG